MGKRRKFLLTSIIVSLVLACSALASLFVSYEFKDGVNQDGYISPADIKYYGSVSAVENADTLPNTVTPELLFNLLPDGTYEVSLMYSARKFQYVVIPDTYQNKAVTRIADEGFNKAVNVDTNKDVDNIYLETVVILGNNLKTVGKKAFYGCLNLATVVLPSSVLDIQADAFTNTFWFNSMTSKYAVVGDGILIKYNGVDSAVNLASVVSMPIKAIAPYAFAGNLALREIRFPATAVYLGERAFEGCRNLITVDTSNGISNLKSVGIYAFKDTLWLQNQAVTFANSNGGYVIFGNSVLLLYVGSSPVIDTPTSCKIIADGAFANNEDVILVNINNLVEYIGNRAFEACINLTTVTFMSGSKLTEIGESAFAGSGVSDVKIGSFPSTPGVILPASLVKVGAKAFSNCAQLTSIIINRSSSSDMVLGAGWVDIRVNLKWDVNAVPTSTALFVPNDGSNYTLVTGIGELVNGQRTYTIQDPLAVYNGQVGINVPVRAGYNFGGWYTTSEFSPATLWDFVSTDSQYYIRKHIVFYAKWIPAEGIIKFDLNSTITVGNSIVMADQTVMMDTPTRLNPLPRVFGYTFMGWSTSKGGTPMYADNATYTMQSNSGSAIITGGFVTGYTVTLYAVWYVDGTPGLLYEKIADTDLDVINGLVPKGTWEVSVPVSDKDINKVGVDTAQYISDIVIPAYVGGIEVTRVKRGGFAGIYPGDEIYRYNYKTTSGALSIDTKSPNPLSGASPYRGNEAYDYYFSGLDMSVSRTITKGGVTYDYTYINGNFDRVIMTDRPTTREHPGLPNLKSVTIPNTVRVIDEKAFENCYNLVKVVSHSGSDLTGTDSNYDGGSQLRLIRRRAFWKCINLVDFKVTRLVNEIGDYAFYRCSKLANISFVPVSNLKIIGHNVFQFCTALEVINLPSNLEKIGNYAFDDCTRLKTVTFGGIPKLTNIGDCAFRRCIALVEIDLPISVKYIGTYAFYKATALRRLTFDTASVGGSLVSIGHYAFAECHSLGLPVTGEITHGATTKLYFPATTEQLGYRAFYNCKNLWFAAFRSGSKLKKLVESDFAGGDYINDTNRYNIVAGVVIGRTTDDGSGASGDVTGCDRTDHQHNRLCVVDGRECASTDFAHSVHSFCKDPAYSREQQQNSSQNPNGYELACYDHNAHGGWCSYRQTHRHLMCVEGCSRVHLHDDCDNRPISLYDFSGADYDDRNFSGDPVRQFNINDWIYNYADSGSQVFTRCLNLEELEIPGELQGGNACHATKSTGYTLKCFFDHTVREAVNKSAQQTHYNCYYHDWHANKTYCRWGYRHTNERVEGVPISLWRVGITEGTVTTAVNLLENCDWVIQVDLPVSIITVSKRSMYDMSRLETVFVPVGCRLDTIDEYAFAYNYKLRTLNFLNCTFLRYIKYRAFYYAFYGSPLTYTNDPMNVDEVLEYHDTADAEYEAVDAAPTDTDSYKHGGNTFRPNDTYVPNSTHRPALRTKLWAPQTTPKGIYSTYPYNPVSTGKGGASDPHLDLRKTILVAISAEAFGECKGFNEVSFPYTLQNLAWQAFIDNAYLLKVTFESSRISEFRLDDSMGDSIFIHCNRIKEMTIPGKYQLYRYFGTIRLNCGKPGGVFTDCVDACIVYGPNHLYGMPYKPNGYTSTPTMIDKVGNDEEEKDEYVLWVGIKGLHYNSRIPASLTKINVCVTNDAAATLDDTIPGYTKYIIADGFLEGCVQITDVYIPASIMQIGNDAFRNCVNIVNCNIEVNSRLEIIGNKAFERCINLKTNYSVSIIPNVTLIGEDAFKNVFAMTYIDIGPLTHSIGSGAFNMDEQSQMTLTTVWQDTLEKTFYNRSRLERITVSHQNLRYVDIDGVLFYRGRNYGYKDFYKKEVAYTADFDNITGGVYVFDTQAFFSGADSDIDGFHACFDAIIGNLPVSSGTESPVRALIQYPNGKTTYKKDEYDKIVIAYEYEIPGSVQIIEPYAFENCDQLEKITFGKSYVESGANKGMQLDQNNQLNVIHKNAFSDCDRISEISIPYTCTLLGVRSFAICRSLVNINYELEITTSSSSMVRPTALGASAQPVSQLEGIMDEAFLDCNKINIVIVRYNVTKIGKRVWFSCDELTTVIFDDYSQLTKIGDYVFGDCLKLASMKIPGKIVNMTTGVTQFAGIPLARFFKSANSYDYTTGYRLREEPRYSVATVETAYKTSTPTDKTLYVKSSEKSIYTTVHYHTGSSTAYWPGVAPYCTEPTHYTSVYRDTGIPLNLKHIEFTEGTTHIVDGFAYNCGTLEETSPTTYITQGIERVYFPLTLVQIGNVANPNNINTVSYVYNTGAFRYCRNLLTAAYNENNMVTVSVDSGNEIVQASRFAFTDLEVIGDYSFYGCTILGQFNHTPGLRWLSGFFFQKYSMNDYESLVKNELEGLSGLRVIGEYAVANCRQLGSIVLSSRLERLGAFAFANTDDYYHTNLTTVNFLSDFDTDDYTLTGLTPSDRRYGTGTMFYPDNTNGLTGSAKVVSVGKSIFYGAAKLAVLDIPGHVFTIPYVFGADTSNIYYNFSNGTINKPAMPYDQHYISSKYSGMSGVSGTLYQGFPSSIQLGIEINYRTPYLCDDLFFNCDNIQSVIIPDSVARIGKRAFFDCDEFENIVVKIEAFATGNTHLKTGGVSVRELADVKITSDLPENLKIIDDEAFWGCEKLVPNYRPIFEDGNQVDVQTFVKLNNNIETIGMGAFYGLPQITLINLDFENIRTVGNSAFANCANVTFAEIGPKLQNLGTCVFDECKLLRRFSVNTLNKWFAGDDGRIDQIDFETVGAAYNGMLFKYATIGSGDDEKLLKYKRDGNNDIVYDANNRPVMEVIADGENAAALRVINQIVQYPADFTVFANSGAVRPEEFYMSNDITHVWKHAFQHAADLKLLHFSNSLEVIGAWDYHGCSNLIRLQLGSNEDVTNRYSDGNEKYPVGFNIHTIEASAFDACYSVKEIFVANSVRTMGKGVFRQYNPETKQLYNTLETLTFPGRFKLMEMFSTSPYYAPGSIYASQSGNREIPTSLHTVRISMFVDRSTSSYAFLDNIITLAESNYIVGSAGYDVDSVKYLYIPDSIEDIRDYAYWNDNAVRSQLESVNFYNLQSSIASSTSKLRRIGDYAFSYNVNLKESYDEYGINVMFSIENLEYIGRYAYYYCSALKELAVPRTVTQIGEYAYSYCTNAESFIIEDWSLLPKNNLTVGGTTAVGQRVLFGSNNIKTIRIPSDIFPLQYIFGAQLTIDLLTEAQGSGNQFYISPKLEIIKINTGSTYVIDRFLYNVDTVVDFALPYTVRYIGIESFAQCNKLTNIVIYDGIRVQDDYFKLLPPGFDTSIYDSQMTGVKSRAFYNCPLLKSITLPMPELTMTNYDYGGVTHSISLLERNYLMTNYQLNLDSNPVTVTVPSEFEIGSEAFRYCSSLEGVYYPERTAYNLSRIDVKTINSYAFSNCTSLKYMHAAYYPDFSLHPYIGQDNVIFENLVTIGSYAFQGDYNISKIYIPASVKTIGTYAFYNCASTTVGLKNVYFSRTAILETINDYAFSGCKFLQEIVIPCTTLTIGKEAFINNSAMYALTFEIRLTEMMTYEYPRITSIGDSAFRNCISLKESLRFFDGNNNYITSNFERMYADTIISTPKLNGAGGDNRLDATTFAATPVFKGYLELASSLITIGKEAFRDCDALESIFIPKTVKTIGYAGFYSCNELVTVRFETGSQLTTMVEENNHISYDVWGSPYNDGTNASRVFSYCNKIQAMYIPGNFRLQQYFNNSVDCDNDLSAYRYAVEAVPKSLKLVSFIDSTVTIVGSVLYDCNYVKYVRIPSTTTTLGTYAMAECNSLLQVFIGTEIVGLESDEGKLLNIPDYCFQNSAKLRYVGKLIIHGADQDRYLDVGPYGEPAMVDGLYEGLTVEQYIEKYNVLPSSGGNKYIGIYSFNGCLALRYIEIPMYFTEIKPYAFYGCTALEKVGFGFDPLLTGGVTTIGEGAFLDCSKLKRSTSYSTWLYIPYSVTSIGAYAFKNCVGLTGVQFAPNSTLKNIYAQAFYGCTNLKFVDDTTPFALPDSLENIYYEAFALDAKLTQIVIPAAVKQIQYRAFYNCSEITFVKFNENSAFTTMLNAPSTSASYIFSGCNKIREMWMPGNLTLPSYFNNVGPDVPQSLKNVYFIKNVATGVNNICANALKDCVYVENVRIWSSTTTMGVNAFQNCSELYQVKIGERENDVNGDLATLISSELTEIPNNAFSGCSKLKLVGPSVYSVSLVEEGFFRDSVNGNLPGIERTYIEKYFMLPDKKANARIGTYAFYQAGLVYVNIPTNYITIDKNAFELCVAMDSLNFLIPDAETAGVQTIGDKAFFDCKTLRGTANTNLLLLPFTLKTIGISAFENCVQLSAIYYVRGNVSGNTTINTIGNRAFANCTALKFNSTSTTESKAFYYYMPDTVVTIGYQAYLNCTSLKRIDISKKVTSIGYSAFENCSSIEEIKFEDESALTAANIGVNVFRYCKSVNTMYVMAHLHKLQYFFGADLSMYTPAPLYDPDTTDYYGNVSAPLFPVRLKTLYIIEGSTSIVDEFAYNADRIINYYVATTVKTIGKTAFFQAARMTTFVIYDAASGYPNPVFPTRNSQMTDIKDNAFDSVMLMEDINLPDSLVTIGPAAFYDTKNLKYVYITANAGLKTIGTNAFVSSGLKEFLIPGDTPDGTSYIPNNVTAINAGAFEQTKQDIISLPEALVSIGSTAFSQAASTKIFIRNIASSNLTSIGDSAFSLAKNLVEFILPEKITALLKSTFDGCDSLTRFQFYGTSKLTSIGETAFANCIALKYSVGTSDFVLPASLNTIGMSAFASSGLVRIVIPKFTNVVNSFAFSGCKSLINAEFENGTLFGYALSGVAGAYTKGGALPNATTTMIDLFGNCTALQSVKVPGDVMPFWSLVAISANLLTLQTVTISEGSGSIMETFLMTDNLIKTVNVAATVKSIEKDAFTQSKIVTLNIPAASQMTVIKQTAFDAATALTTVNIGAGNALVTISQSAFRNCTALKTFNMVTAANLQVIGDQAFSGCIALTDFIDWNSGVNMGTLCVQLQTIGVEAFKGCNAMVNLTLPYVYTLISNSAFYGCASLKRVEMLGVNPINGIGDFVFNNCTALEDISLVYNAASAYYTYDGVLYSHSGSDYKLIVYPAGKTNTSYTVGLAVGNIIEIVKNAFEGAVALTDITLPSTLTTIGASAFYNTSLNKLFIPAAVTTIGTSAFDISTLTKVEFEVNSSYNAANKEWLFASAVLTELVLPAHVSPIAMFVGAKTAVPATITKVTYLESASTSIILPNAMKGAAGLTTVVISNNITGIGANAFDNNAVTNGGKIATVTFTNPALPSKITSIGANAFDNNRTLTKFGDSNPLSTLTSLTTIGNYAFRTTHLTGLELPASLETIGTYAFYIDPADTSLSTYKLTGTLTIPASVTTIGLAAFNGNDLTELKFAPSSKIATVADAGTTGAFAGNFNLTKLTLPVTLPLARYLGSVTVDGTPDGVASITLNIIPSLTSTVVCKNFADGAVDVVSINLDDLITVVDEYAFRNITKLSSFDLRNVTTLNKGAFEGMASGMLGGFILNNGSSLITIGEAAFKNAKIFSYNQMSGLTQLTSIGVDAFNGTTFDLGITEIPVYAFVALKTIGNNAFINQTKVKTVYLTDVMTSIGTSAFKGCTNLTTLNITNGVGALALTISANAFEGTGITSLIIPARQITIGASAFTNIAATSIVVAASPSISIGASAFANSLQLTDAEIGYGVPQPTGTNNNWFSGCTSLASLTISGEIAFTNYIAAGVTSLKTLTLNSPSPIAGVLANNVYIETLNISAATSATFPTLTNIKYVNVTGGNYTSENNAVYLNTTLVTYAPKNPATTLTLKGGTTAVGASAFKDNAYLTEVIFPSTLASIGNNAFDNAVYLDTADLSGTTLTSIGEYAFRNTKITSVTFPSTLKDIGQYAFNNTSLTTVTMPSTLTGTLGAYIFAGNSKLTTAVVEYGVPQAAGKNWFSNCTVLQELTISGEVVFTAYIEATVTTLKTITFNTTGNMVAGALTGNVNITMLNVTAATGATFPTLTNIVNVNVTGGSFTSDSNAVYLGTTLIAYAPKNTATSLAIKSGTTIINASVFASNTVLVTVVFPSTLTSIGNSAFDGATSLVTADISGTALVSIGEYAFRNTKITSLVFPSTLKNIGQQAFNNTSITSVTMPSTLTGTLGTNIFASNTKLITAVVEYGVPQSGVNNWFTGCSALQALTISGEYVFTNYIAATVTTLKTLTLNTTGTLLATVLTGNTYIETLNITAATGTVFPTLTNIINVNITGGSFTSDSNAVYLGTTLIAYASKNTATTLTIKSGTEAINASVFANNTVLVTVILPSSLKTIGASAFAGASGGTSKLATVNMSGTALTDIGANAFQYTKITSVSFPATLKNIGASAFANTSLATVTMPSTLTGTLGANLFSNSTLLTTAVVEYGVPQSGTKNWFTGCSALQALTISGEYAFTEYIAATVTTLKTLTLNTTGTLLAGVLATNVNITTLNVTAATGTVFPTLTNIVTVNVTGGSFTSDSSAVYLGTALIAFAPKNTATSLTIKSGTTTINANVFASNTVLVTVVFPTSLISIGNSAFDGATNLATAALNTTALTSIGDYAFRNTKLTLINLPSTLTTIGQYAFSGCASATAITYTGSVLSTIGQYAFSGCTKITTFSINNITTTANIGAYAFQNVGSAGSTTFTWTFSTGVTAAATAFTGSKITVVKV